MAIRLQSAKLADLRAQKIQHAVLSFRASQQDAVLMDAVAIPDETVADLFRRALRRLSQEKWESQLRHDASRLADEDLNADGDLW